jgi:hypothetical protein
MKVDVLITAIDSEYDNSYTDANKLDWINAVELRYKLEVDQDLDTFEISRQANVAGYDLPAGVQFEDIKIVYIDGRPADYIDLTSDKKEGYYKGTDGKFTIYPIPTVSDITPGINGTNIIRPAAKVIGNKATDDLLIPDEFIDTYKYYANWKMSLLNKNFGEANNWAVLYNKEFGALSRWKHRTKPKTAAVLSCTKNVI